ncbi:MAG: hypothetical protein IPH94_13830 [Saprospiraceae bacterium]|nr:hypothetical protein [Saprospiraceae bacterium]
MNPDQTFELTYTIRFQNIGNDTAIDVSFQSYLHRFGPQQLPICPASHPCNLQLYGDARSRFSFDFPAPKIKMKPSARVSSPIPFKPKKGCPIARLLVIMLKYILIKTLLYLPILPTPW